jgi:hypothetical protein
LKDISLTTIKVNIQISSRDAEKAALQRRQVVSIPFLSNLRPSVAYCTCVFGLIKMKFRRLIVLICDDVVMFFVRGRRLI